MASIGTDGTEKMSKSLGNVIGIPDLLSRHSYDEVRWFYAMTHYRSKLSFSDDLIDSAVIYSSDGEAVQIAENEATQIIEQAYETRPAGNTVQELVDSSDSPYSRLTRSYERVKRFILTQQDESKSLYDQLDRFARSNSVPRHWRK